MALWSEIPFESIYLEPSKNGINRPRSTRGNGYKMINMGELFAYSRINNPEMELVPLDDDEKKKYGVQEGDLLFARQSLVKEGAGKCSIVISVPEPTCFEGHLIRVRLDQAKAHPLFYYYYFSSYEGKGKVQSLVMQVAAAGIRGSELAKLSIPYPPLPIQRKIADVLSAYDDLIEVNTRRIRILEQMAGSVYREWFGKVDVKFLPEGWKLTKLSNLVETQYGFTESASGVEVGPKFVRGMDINKNSYIQWDEVPYCPIEKNELPKFKLSIGDIMVIRMADPGKVGIVEKDLNAVFASYLIRLKIKSPKLSPYFLFYYLLSDRYQNYVTGASTGTTRKSASAGVITDVDIILSPDEIRMRFEIYVSELRQLLNNLLDQNTNLRRTRDLLLPRLVSGEVAVHE